MRLLDTPLYEIPWFSEVREKLKSGAPCIVNGSADSHKLHLISALSEGIGRPLIVTWSDRRAREICEEFLFYDREALVYPAKDLIFYQADISGRELSTERLKVCRRIASGEAGAVVTTFDALLGECLPAELLKDSVLTIDKDAVADEQEIAVRLTAMGYEKNYQVEAPGQFSIRGGILDIFDMTAENPYRIELWGDTVESVRSFDVLSQRSVEVLEHIEIYPASELILSEEEKRRGFARIKKEAEERIDAFYKAVDLEPGNRLKRMLGELEDYLIHGMGTLNLESYLHYFYDETSSFLSLFSEKPCIFLDEPQRLKEHADGVVAEFRESMSNRLAKGYLLSGQTRLLRDYEEVLEELRHYGSVQLSALECAEGMLGGETVRAVNARTLSSYNGSFRALSDNLKKLKKEKYRIVILSASRSRAKRLADDLTEEGIITSYTENAEKKLQQGEIVTWYGRIRKGFTYPELRYTVITETDIFGAEHKSKRKRPKYSGGSRIESVGDLKVGDYVIHEDCGVGIYRGIEEIEVERVRKDYMKIEYRDSGNLYVLATALDKVQFYADRTAKPPRLNRLGTQEWNRTKAKVQESVTAIAHELVELYAKRSVANGYVYSEDTVWQREFEEMFPFEETEDQLNAIRATKEDMESGKVMDRLICGDVGFGKTEVAIRAAFKAVQEGKQVAYLVPTTILAEQHYHTFRERMMQYPVRVDMLSRFRSSAQIRESLKDLKAGKVDIVIGTHRLLSKDVEYHDLGLLIIDEEQRFGVTHKEKIKHLKETVDVLTLTATPIPRTLHMSLIGIRDMSLLEEPPRNRLPIQTYVCEYNEEMVREAIRRELSRGGQVYYVYNRVDSIDTIAAKIAELVPEARVSFAHGQMNERQLEDIMMAFIRQEVDVLISTTIIETGLDIPNVNTMIIHDSDQMGLSQLYQLRGRVGRSDRTSYAFLMYGRNKVLREVAEKRLTAIREFTELGSGYKIAMRDLEIRGAGNLLGKQQHGHIEAVGYDLYCRMLEEAVREEKGLEAKEETDCTIDLDVDAYLPPEYIVNEVQKLDIYRRIAAIRSREEEEEMQDELKDRFGSLPAEALRLLRIARIKARAKQDHVTDIRGKIGKIRITMERTAPVNVDLLPPLIRKYGGSLKLQTAGNPQFIYTYEGLGLKEEDTGNLLEETEHLISEIEGLLEERPETENTVTDGDGKDG